MEPIGKIKTVSPKGDLILVSSRAPRMGDRVLDDRGQPVGKVTRIFGPVSRPYAAVRPLKERTSDLWELIGKPVFKDKNRPAFKPKSRGDRYGKKKGKARRYR